MAKNICFVEIGQTKLPIKSFSTSEAENNVLIHKIQHGTMTSPKRTTFERSRICNDFTEAFVCEITLYFEEAQVS